MSVIGLTQPLQHVFHSSNGVLHRWFTTEQTTSARVNTTVDYGIHPKLLDWVLVTKEWLRYDTLLLRQVDNNPNVQHPPENKEKIHEYWLLVGRLELGQVSEMAFIKELVQEHQTCWLRSPRFAWRWFWYVKWVTFNPTIKWWTAFLKARCTLQQVKLTSNQ